MKRKYRIIICVCAVFFSALLIVSASKLNVKPGKHEEYLETSFSPQGTYELEAYLVNGGATTDSKRHFCMAGFELRNTLSENGGVTRGVCQADENGFMTDILETENIEKIDGKAGVRTDDGINFYPDDTLV